jgi:hypothetical protein
MGQVSRGRWDKSTGTGKPEQIAWAGQLGQLSVDRLAYTRQPGQADETAQPGQADMTGQPGQVSWTVQPGQDIGDKSAGTGQPGQVRWDRLAEIGRPRQVYQGSFFYILYI